MRNRRPHHSSISIEACSRFFLGTANQLLQQILLLHIPTMCNVASLRSGTFGTFKVSQKGSYHYSGFYCKPRHSWHAQTSKLDNSQTYAAQNEKSLLFGIAARPWALSCLLARERMSLKLRAYNYWFSPVCDYDRTLNQVSSDLL